MTQSDADPASESAVAPDSDVVSDETSSPHGPSAGPESSLAAGDSGPPPATWTPFFSALVLSHATQILAAGPDRYRVENSISGRSLEIDGAGLQLLRTFQLPMLAARAARDTKLDPEEAEALIAQARELGILAPIGLESSAPTQLTRTPELSLFRVPTCDPGVGMWPADFCFFGVPYELGRTGLAGASAGPDSLRGYSQTLFSGVDLDTGRISGWFDYDRRRTLLRAASLVDAGNVLTLPGEAPVDIFVRVSELVDTLLRAHAIPVGLGGDHSITAPILRGYGGREVSVVHFDAHSDLEDVLPPETLHHGNVIRRVLELPGIRDVSSFGLRGLGSQHQESDLVRWSWTSASELREGGVELLVSRLPRGGPVYVTVDLDVIDPAYVPAVGTPLPGGLSPTLLKELLWAVGSHLDVVGIDFVELSPRGESDVSLGIASELILTLVGAVHERMNRGSPG